MSVYNHNTSWHDTNRGVSCFIAVYIAFYLLIVYLGKKLHGSPRVSKFLPEAGMVIIVGVIAGCLFLPLANNYGDEMAGDVAGSVLTFDASVFFIILLPPIIFNSGYHLHRQLLHRYFNPICLLAFVGTMLSTLMIASMLYLACMTMLKNSFTPSFVELLAFGALISATDPVSTLAVFSAKKVDPQLFYLLSGESLLNDAVGLVLFEAFAHLIEVETQEGFEMNLVEEFGLVIVDVMLNFCGSLILGFLFGLVVAYALKAVDLRHHLMLELSAYVLIMYAPFVLAEICRLSGIVTVLFAGLAARRYAEPNLSKFTAEHSDTIFRLISHMTETLIFLELGLSVIPLLSQGFNVGFVLLSLGACLIARALNVYPLTFTYNFFQTCLQPIPGTSSSSPSSRPTKAIANEEDSKSDSSANSEDSLIRKASEYKPAHDEEVGAPSAPATSTRTTSDEKNAPLLHDDEAKNDMLIPRRTIHFLFLSGLRGAVSYGLVKMFPDVNGNKVTFEVTTMLIVLITTFVFGGGTEVALNKLNIPIGVDEDEFMKSLAKKGSSKAGAVGWWSQFDSTRIRPLVVRGNQKPKISLEDKDDDEFAYHKEGHEEQVEVTESDFVETAKKGSIYDFGQ